MADTLLWELTEGQLANSGILNHLSTLIRQQITNKSSLKGMNDLEVFSYFLRKNHFNFEQFMKDNHLNHIMNLPHLETQYVRSVNRLNSKLNQLSNRKPYLRPNLMDQFYALKQCGISLGQTNYVHLAQVLKTIAAENQCIKIRFWGKIIGYKDYYVIQGSSTKKYINDLGSDSQNYGTGINSYSYWVTNNILGNWIELPLVTPLQVKQSRNFKYIFTGNLEKQIQSLGKFQGLQKHLLKCIIARITHSCELAPKGLYKMNEENPAIMQFEQQFKMPEVAEMNAIQNWIHLNSHILNQGRSSYFFDPKLSQQQKEALNTQLGESDPMIERLKSISQDKPFEALGYTSNWALQLCGQTIPISLIGKQQGQSALYASVLLRNLVWSGAATVGFKGGWVNIYIGYGHKISQQNSLIKQLNNIQIQGQSKKEYSEPYPKKAPVLEQKPIVENPPAEDQ